MPVMKAGTQMVADFGPAPHGHSAWMLHVIIDKRETARARAEKWAAFDALAASTDRPVKPERVTRSVAKTLVSEASAMDKNGNAHASAPTVGASKSEAKALIEQARARV